jgi:hypothetical protein
MYGSGWSKTSKKEKAKLSQSQISHSASELNMHELSVPCSSENRSKFSHGKVALSKNSQFLKLPDFVLYTWPFIIESLLIC